MEATEPAWSRPALIAVVLLAGGLTLIDVTRSGYGNTYYAAGALAASHSWTALFTNAADLSGYVSLDKGPLPDWMMGLSGHLLGFSNLSVMLPNALCGIFTVVVLHDTVRRTLGHQIAILAALTMALTPVAVLVARYNNPDELLLLLLVCAAWTETVAAQSGRLRELLLCAVLVGLAFNTKMLEAYLVLPGLVASFLVTRRASARRRLGELAIAGGTTLLVSFVWFGGMMLVPADGRPYVGDSTDNSWFQLILGGNGVQRVTGAGGAFGRNIERNLMWLFSRHVAGQIAWLLPLALIGMTVGLLTTWRSRRTSPAFGAYTLWGVWTLLGGVLLSLSAGIRHAYYTSLLAPAVATLAAAALVTLWRATRRSPIVALCLSAIVACTPLLSFVLLAHSGGFVPWLRWVVLACGAVAGAMVVAPHLHVVFRGAAMTALTLAAGAVALLAGPAAYSIATVSRSLSGSDPTAGPLISESKPATAGVHSNALSTKQSRALLIRYLQTHRGNARFIVAATDARNAGPIALATGQPVITLDGFGGFDPAPTAGQLDRLIELGQLRYVLLDTTSAQPRSTGNRVLSAPAWVKRHCSPIPYSSIIPHHTTGVARPRSTIVSKLTLFICEPAAQPPHSTTQAALPPAT